MVMGLQGFDIFYLTIVITDYKVKFVTGKSNRKFWLLKVCSIILIHGILFVIEKFVIRLLWILVELSIHIPKAPYMIISKTFTQLIHSTIFCNKLSHIYLNSKFTWYNITSRTIENCQYKFLAILSAEYFRLLIVIKGFRQFPCNLRISNIINTRF